MKDLNLKEDQDEVEIFNWKALNIERYPDLKYLFSTFNNVRMSRGQARQLKKRGRVEGTPDIILDVPMHGYHGLRIELKRKRNGAVKKSQKEWLAGLNSMGYLAVVCKGHKAAIEIIEAYINPQSNYDFKGIKCEEVNYEVCMRNNRGIL